MNQSYVGSREEGGVRIGKLNEQRGKGQRPKREQSQQPDTKPMNVKD